MAYCKKKKNQFFNDSCLMKLDVNMTVESQYFICILMLSLKILTVFTFTHLVQQNIIHFTLKSIKL